MERIKVLIVEDELIVSEELKEILEDNGYEVVGQSNTVEGTIEAVLRTSPDVVLMDIHLKDDGDGIDLAERILSLNQSAIIFLTAYDDHKLIERARRVKPAAYIVKPFEERNLKVAIDMGFANLMDEQNSKGDLYRVENRIFVKQQSRFKKLDIDEIFFAEAIGSYTEIHTESGKTTISINLKNFETKLSHPKFMRVHRSFLINLDKVEEYEGNSIFMNGRTIPLSGTNKDNFLRRIKLF